MLAIWSFQGYEKYKTRSNLIAHSYGEVRDNGKESHKQSRDDEWPHPRLEALVCMRVAGLIPPRL